MKKNVPTKKLVTEGVDHYYCNNCGEEMEEPSKISNERNGVEITLTFDDSFVTFDLCPKCISKMIKAFKIPPSEIDRREG